MMPGCRRKGGAHDWGAHDRHAVTTTDGRVGAASGDRWADNGARESGTLVEGGEGEVIPGGVDDMLAWASAWLAKHGHGPWPVSGCASLGEERLVHGQGMAQVLALQGADPITRMLGLLVCSEPWPDQNELDARLGDDMGAYLGTLLANCQRLLDLPFGALVGSAEAPGQSQPEVLRRMTLAMARDVRVVMVHLASALQSLRHVAAGQSAGGAEQARDSTLPVAGIRAQDEAVSVQDASRLAREVLQVLAPLANRLGLYRIKWEMEDLAFRCLEPVRYRELARALDSKKLERDAFVANAGAELAALLNQNGIQAEVKGRSKHIYSIHNKLRAKNLSIEKLHDLRALRVMVESLADCYATLDLVHQRWVPQMDELDDYIADPKPNGYQSLHTVVMADDGRPMEVQIRTRAMHDAAEYGLAAHWRYKERGTATGGKVVVPSLDGEARISWLRQLLAWQQDLGGTRLPGKETSTADDSVIFAMTPQGRVIELPMGSTAVDFAYHVHTSLGHRCRGARVDGRMLPLNTPLTNGQVVEIVQARAGMDEPGPSRDWLNPVLGFVRSTRARQKVRQWFNAQARGQEQAEGRERVERALAREGCSGLSLEVLAERLKYESTQELFAAVAREVVGARTLEAAIRNEPLVPLLAATAPEPAPEARRAAHPGGNPVLVMGVDFLMTHLAGCCHPVPPDEISGFVTRGRGVSVHRKGCPALAALRARAPERELAVSWGDDWQRPVKGKGGQIRARRYSAGVTVTAEDRTGILRDILDMLAREQCPLLSVRTQTVREVARFTLVLDVSSGQVLDRLLQSIRQIAGVVGCHRA
ncbi:MAG: TGS domain-containing protein [Lautropia sp.]|nr:TGS domain-containing protein [Lautropia sp.]